MGRWFDMMKHSYRAQFAALAGAVAMLSVPFTPAVAAEKAGTEVFQGLVNHVSSNNLKVTDPKTSKTISFLLVPRFNKVFKTHGKTTQQATLKNGQYVKVYYDQKFMGRPHADRVLILNDANVAMKKLHS
jgi:hypothetical protein